MFHTEPLAVEGNIVRQVHDMRFVNQGFLMFLFSIHIWVTKVSYFSVIDVYILLATSFTHVAILCGTHLQGVASSKSPSLSLSPGLSNESAAIVQLRIDLDDERNQNPKQMLEEDEDIVVLTVPIQGLSRKLNEFDSSGCNVFFGLYSLALGLEMAHST